MQVSGKKVLVTGGASGIGLSLSKALLGAGAKVVVCGRTLSKLESARSSLSGLEIVQCDVSDLSQIEALREKCNADFGGIDVLINGAGIYHDLDLIKQDVALERQLLELDIGLSAPMRMLHVFLPDLLERPEAAVVNISSGLAFVPLVRAPVYSAMKAGLHAWSRAIRKQLEDTSVKVFELMPPVIDTQLFSEEQVGMKKMSPDVLAGHFLKAFSKDKYEIVPGQATFLRRMSRLAPNMVFKLINPTKTAGG